MTFTVEVDQNRYLGVGAGQVDAIVTVTADGAITGPAPAADVLEIIIIDCSASMSGEKIRAARRATATAIAQLRDGVSFAVIVGRHDAQQIYPLQRGTAVASAATRTEAVAHVDRLRASGGTGMGIWLALAGELVDTHPGTIAHAILLTDGQNGEDDYSFQTRLDGVTGKFTCDARGVGTDWVPDELRRIVNALLGECDSITDPAGLDADFQALMTKAMGKGIGNVALRLWAPRGAQVGFVKQMSPTVQDLTAHRAEAGPQRGEYPLGTWGAESRDYHVRVTVAPGAVGDEMLAGRVQLVQAGSDDVLGQGMITAVWTDDAALSTRISRGVAHYTGQAELAEVIQEGLAARKAGDEPLATARLGRAVEIAHNSGNEGTAKLLEKVVDVIDAPSGTVRLRARVSDADEITLDTRSTKTVRVTRDGA